MTTNGPILFLDHTAKLGGAELSLARYLRAEHGPGVALGLLCPDAPEGWDLPADVTVRNTRAVAGRSPIRSVVAELKRLIDEVQPSCVVANSYSAAQYLAFVPKRGRRYLYFLRQEALPEGLSRGKNLLNRLFVLRRFDGFLANSSWTAMTLPEQIRRSRPVEISHPISGIQNAAVARDLHPDRPLRLLTLSRLSPWKGVHTAIEAVRLLEGHNAMLTVAGGDLFGEEDYSARLHELARGLNVEFVGHQADTAPLLADADVLLCLSTTPEPFGQVVVQGMANGCVVIATDQGGPRETISSGVDGSLVPAESPEAVHAELMMLLEDPARFAAISANAVQKSRSYLDDMTIPGFTQALVRLAGRT